MKLITTFFLLNIFSGIFSLTDDKSLEDERKPFCNANLTKAFGFEGIKKPIQTKISMCPHITESCCSKDDQIIIFENLVMSNEQNLLQQRFSYEQQIYNYTLDLALHVNQLAHGYLEEYVLKGINNCKILAKRLTHYQPEKVVEKIKSAIYEMHNFFEKSYTGVYCLLCNAELHHFVDIEEETITYNVKFCRKMVIKSLPVLIYLHSHLLNYINLAMQYTSVCDKDGNFKDIAVPKSDLMILDNKMTKNLEDCRNHRNDPVWYAKCKFICDDFSIFEINILFEPYLKEFTKKVELIKENLHHFEKLPNTTHSNQTMLKNNSTHIGEKGLNETINFWDLKPIIPSNVSDTPQVILSENASEIPFSDFDSYWENEGIDFEDIADFSVITRAKYEKIFQDKVERDQSHKPLISPDSFLGSIFRLFG